MQEIFYNLSLPFAYPIELVHNLMYSKMQSILCELDLVPTKLNRLISTGIKRVTSGFLTQFPVKNRVSEPVGWEDFKLFLLLFYFQLDCS